MKQDPSSTALQPVNGQRLCPYAKVPFGWYNIGYCGCVLLAIYNAMLLLGYEPDLMEVRKQLHRVWKPRIFGVRSWEISRCLKKFRIPFRCVHSGKDVVSAMKPGSVAILMTWNRTVPFCHFTMGEAPLSVLRFPDFFGGAHGVAVTLTEKGMWRVYNRFSNRDLPYEYPDYETFCPFPSLFIKGFILELPHEKIQ